MSLLSALRRPKPEAVVRDYAPQVSRHLKRIFGPQADIDDLFQIVFVEVIRSLPSFQGRSKLSTWIRRITWNVAFQEMRSQYRHQCLSPMGVEPAAHQQPVDEHVAHRQSLEHLYRALAQLEPRQRIAVLMHDIEGRTLKETAEILGRPLQTVASQVRAGRGRLGQLIEADSGFGKSRGGHGEASGE